MSEKTKKRLIWGVSIAAGVLLLIAAFALFGNLAVYPGAVRYDVSAEKAQKELAASEYTKDMILFDPSKLSLETKRIDLLLYSHMRYAKVTGYDVVCKPVNLSGTDVRITVQVYDWEAPINGETYRGMPATVTSSETTFGETVTKTLNFYMNCGGHRYTFTADYHPGSLTAAELDALDREITDLLYRAADQVIDSEPASNR